MGAKNVTALEPMSTMPRVRRGVPYVISQRDTDVLVAVPLVRLLLGDPSCRVTLEELTLPFCREPRELRVGRRRVGPVRSFGHRLKIARIPGLAQTRARRLEPGERGRR